MKLLTKAQVCAKIGVARASLDRFRKHEDYAHLLFPGEVKYGFKVFWLEHEIDEWIRVQAEKR